MEDYKRAQKYLGYYAKGFEWKYVLLPLMFWKKIILMITFV